MNIVVIIQTRMNSQRLPGKTLLKINGKTIIEHVVERVAKAQGVDNIIVATSTAASDDQLAEHLHQKKIACFRGNENDVLERYYLAAKHYNADIIIRVCGDQPLVDPLAIEMTLQNWAENTFTYCKHEQGWPDGTGCEIFSFSLLEKAQQLCTDPFEREHIKPFFLNNKYKFKIKTVDAPSDIHSPASHLAVDTAEDFKRISVLLEPFKNGDFIELKEILKRIKSDHQKILNHPL
ncbi:MAG: glycosyltransferase family protein [Nanoarchaeota archaeon]|nr:glycosyltransferase family protein [Nanoarchaeota archaeon]